MRNELELNGYLSHINALTARSLGRMSDAVRKLVMSLAALSLATTVGCRKGSSSSDDAAYSGPKKRTGVADPTKEDVLAACMAARAEWRAGEVERVGKKDVMSKEERAKANASLDAENCERTQKEFEKNRARPKAAPLALADYQCLLESDSEYDFRSCYQRARKENPQPKPPNVRLESKYIKFEEQGGTVPYLSSHASHPDFDIEPLAKGDLYFDKSLRTNLAFGKGGDVSDHRYALGLYGKTDAVLLGAAGKKMPTEFDIEWLDLLGMVEFTEYCGPASKKLSCVSVPVKLVTKDGDWAMDLLFEPSLVSHYMALPAQKGKSLLLPGEDAAASAGDTRLIVVRSTGSLSTYVSQNRIIGKGTRMTDVDRIALIEVRERVLKTCRYRDGAGKNVSLTLDAYDADVTIVERKTGKQLAKRTFRAEGKATCPSGGDRGSVVTQTVNRDVRLPNDGAELGVWAREELAK